MAFLDIFRNKAVSVSTYKMITDEGSGFYAWDGNLYQSDIVRSAIRPKARAIGKAVAKHIRKGTDGVIKVNPDVYMRFLLEEPNPFMTGQMLQEKLITQLELNNNAFAYIARDDNGYPIGIYPITALSCEAIQNDAGDLFMKFMLKTGRTYTFKYSDIIHLRKDFNSNEFFGDSPAQALAPLMEIVTTTDQGIVKAIKNSNIIRWLLKFMSGRPEDVKKSADQFVKDYMSIESTSVGAAAVGQNVEAIQVDPKDFVPNAIQMDRTVQRIFSFYNTNSKIVQGNYSENEWISYYESALEADVIQISNEYTRKLFTRKERGFGNKIVLDGSNLSFASMQTKLGLVQYVDRGIMSPNEVRDALSMAPREGGDEFLLRKDTGMAGA